jgi:PAS domain S-box-containing protein
MNEYRLSDLLDMSITKKMADAFYLAAGIPIGIIDAIDGSILIGAGWQDICVKFHRANPVLRQRCQESDNFIKNHLVEGQACHYKCKNGLWDIGIPIMVAGCHLATMFLGQFFYEDETPDLEDFILVAREFNFDQDDYLAALDRVPRLSHEKINDILEYNKALANFIADLAEHSLLKKQADQALLFTQFAVDHTSEAAYWTGPDGRFLYVNEASCRALGYAREELLAMTIPGICPEFSPKTWLEHWHELRERKTFIFESILKRKDGSAFPVEVSVNYVLFGGHEYNCAFARDISERKRVERELVKAHKLESVGLLAGGIAHDFNNVLTGIMGNASLVKMLLSPQDKAYKYVTNLEVASERAIELTQQFLAFSKGGAPIRKRMCAVEVIRASMRSALSGLKSTCEMTIPDNLWFVDADEGQISQVINNLIVNADQAMPHGGIIRGVCENIELDEANSFFLPKGKYIRISIKDQGMGIPEEDLGKIFDPYFTTKDKGRGLGLASAYAIIKNHAGHISVESQTRGGSTFLIYLPASASPAIVSGEETAEVTAAGKEKILVMDDEEVVSAVVGEMLEHLGYDASFAKDGEQALAMYSEALTSGRPFDAIIMDLTIPGGMGGKVAIGKLMEMDPDARAIVSSGYSDDPVMADFRRYGFAGMIVKPFNLEKLGEQVSRVLRR